MRAILAYLTAKPGKEAEFQEKMTAQAKRCLANEPGCLQFDVAQDPIFMFGLPTMIIWYFVGVFWIRKLVDIKV